MTASASNNSISSFFRTPVFILFSLLFSLIVSFSAHAEDKAIIVFDASGSMWGQLEGKTKIAIAKKTLADVVTNWNEEKQLGLLAYGHRRKGDCKDIETLVPVGKINKAAMIAKVNNINPKGKTPISASIRMAADELKFTEDNATVILISDGKETCNANPCDTAAELEKLGVNFTAHVIGFGVDKKTSEQLQCIARNTGGLYFTANNAEQLSVALKQIVVKAKVISIRAMDEKNGGIFHKMIDWKLIHQDTEEVISLKGSGAGVEILLVGDETDKYSKNIVATKKSITSGNWLVSGTSGNYSGETTVTIENEDQLIKVDFNKELPKITLKAANEAITGTEIDVSWEAPKGLEGLINLQIIDDKPKYHASPLKYTKDKTQATLRLPSVAGDYLLRFYDNEDRIVLAEHPIKLKEAEIVITAPEEAGTGTEIDLSWIAPKDAEAKINLEMVGEKPKFHSNPHYYIKNKKEGVMRMPSIAGDYVLRWYNLSDRKVVVEKPIKLIEEQITISAPDEAGTGTEIDLSWIAPKTAEAKINLEPVGEKPKFHSNPHIYTKKKTEGTMRMPSAAGDYILRWYNLSDRKIVVEKALKLVEEQISINAPDEISTGTELDLSWDAPKTAEAKINLELVGEKPKYHSNPHIYTKKKTEGTMRMPSAAGDYILRWYNLSDRKTVIEKPIKLVESTITLNAPDEAGAGTEIDLSWEAPKTAEAKITLEPIGEKPKYHSNPHLYIRKKKEGVMRMPSQEGDFVLRWYNISDQKIITERPIKLTAQTITLNAPETAEAGSEIELSWDAPKGLDSFINIHPSDEKPNYNARTYIYTKKKTSAYMRMPSVPGDYTLRWYNRNDKKPLAETNIKLTELEITLTAEDEAIAGTETEVSWSAPKGLDSFINIQLADEKPNYNAKKYIYTKKKSSDYLRLPSEPGEYILRWYNRSHKKPIAQRPIKLNAPEILISVPENIKADSEVEISWQAPKGLDNSFINIQPQGEKPNYNAKKYIYTKKKQSEYMKMPAEAGEYILRWYNRGTTKPITEKKITINSSE